MIILFIITMLVCLYLFVFHRDLLQRAWEVIASFFELCFERLNALLRGLS